MNNNWILEYTSHIIEIITIGSKVTAYRNDQ